MRLQSINRYEAYKDSGVEWLGEVPAHWLEQRVKDIALLERGKFTHRPRNDPQMYDGEHPFIQTGDVARANKYVNNYKQTLSDKGTEVSKKFKKGTLLMAIAANIGDVAILGFDSYLPDSIVGYKPKKTDTDYLFYLFTATKIELNRIKITSTQDNLNLERLNSLIKFVAPFPEQRAIAAYLDTQTAQIDRKIDLLSQKAAQYGKLKQSLINETVTRGLDKTVAMKDSGAEWIGEAPAHWEVKRVKELGNLVLGKMLDNVKGENTFYRSYLKSKNIGWLKVEDSNIEKMYFSLAEMKSYRLKKDDILLSEGGEVGKTCFWNDEIEECYIQNSVHKITVCKNNSPRFFLYQSFLLGSIKYYDSIVNHVSIKHLTKEKLSRVNWVRPPFEEQQAIANYLDEKTAHIDRIVDTINSQIDKLKELRKTLINDVVTGKIKVA